MIDNVEEYVKTIIRNASFNNAELFSLCKCENESEERQVRHIVSQITDIPIGSSKRGIFFCRTRKDLDEAEAQDLSRVKAFISKIRKRRYAFANWQTEVIVPCPSHITPLSADYFIKGGAM